MGAVLVAEPFAELLDYIVRDLVITDGQKDVDLNASADEDATVIDAQKRQFAASAVEQARALLPAFRTGIVLAFEAQGMGKSEIPAGRSRRRAKRDRRRADHVSRALRSGGLA